MKNKLIVVTLSLLLLLSACAKADDNKIENDTTNTSAIYTVDEVQQELSSEKGEVSDVTSDKKTSSVTTKKNSGVASQNNTNETQNITVKNEAVTERQSSNNSLNQGAVEEKRSADITVSVNCKNAINYGILSVGTFSQVLPNDGIILSSTTVTVNENESVMNAVKKILKANNITFSITSSGYIRSIGGLSEFDCGPTSGWLYKVNGELPNVSTKSYKLKQGDVVELIYTCVQGDV